MDFTCESTDKLGDWSVGSTDLAILASLVKCEMRSSPPFGKGPRSYVG
jgi:hypothetical protein